MPWRSERESKQDFQSYNTWRIWSFALSFHQKKTWGKVFLVVVFVCFDDDNALNSWPGSQSIHKHFIRSQRLFREFPDWLSLSLMSFSFPGMDQPKEFCKSSFDISDAIHWYTLISSEMHPNVKPFVSQLLSDFFTDANRIA
jgi:hypothetical protein